MALFKIFNNIDSGNTTLPSTYTKGYMYYDAQSSIFYIDIAGNGGETGIRQKINAWGAEKTLKDSRGQQIDTTYIKNITINNNQLSFTTGDDTVITIEGTLGAVTGVKGNSETIFRVGDVNITAANILGTAAIGSTTIPVYWDGTTFSPITSYNGTAAQVAHTLTFGNGAFVFDGSADVTVPVYTGSADWS